MCCGKCKESGARVKTDVRDLDLAKFKGLADGGSKPLSLFQSAPIGDRHNSRERITSRWHRQEEGS